MAQKIKLSTIADARAQADYEIDRKAEAEVDKILHLLEALVEHHILLVDDAVDDDILESSSLVTMEE